VVGPEDPDLDRGLPPARRLPQSNPPEGDLLITSVSDVLTCSAADVTPEPTDVSRVDPRVTSDAGRVTSGAGRVTSGATDVTSEPADVSRVDARVTSDAGRVTSGGSDVTSEPTDVSRVDARVTSDAGRVTSGGSDVTSEPTDVSRVGPRVRSGAGHVTSGAGRVTSGGVEVGPGLGVVASRASDTRSRGKALSTPWNVKRLGRDDVTTEGARGWAGAGEVRASPRDEARAARDVPRYAALGASKRDELGAAGAFVQ
jgi:hypothetical protein